MIKEIINYYDGDFILSFGRSFVILVGQEFDDKLVCEKFIIYQKSDDNYSHWGEVLSAPIIKGHIENLEDFVKGYGLEHIKSTIQLEAFKVLTEDKRDYTGEIKVNLRDASDIYFLMYLNDKTPKELNWIYRNTSSEKLKKLIEISKGITITKRSY